MAQQKQRFVRVLRQILINQFDGWTFRGSVEASCIPLKECKERWTLSFPVDMPYLDRFESQSYKSFGDARDALVRGKVNWH